MALVDRLVADWTASRASGAFASPHARLASLAVAAMGVQGSRVLVIGTEAPWLEALLLSQDRTAHAF
jgi:glycosyltransferase A (GT-A) superfamily protein (DUF2064 family)